MRKEELGKGNLGYSVSYQFGSRAPVSVKEIKAGTEIFVIRIPKDLDLGQTRLEIRTLDITGIETVYEDYIIVIGSNGRDLASDSFMFTWVRPHTREGQIILSIGETLTGFFSGGPVESVEVEHIIIITPIKYDGLFIKNDV